MTIKGVKQITRVPMAMGGWILSERSCVGTIGPETLVVGPDAPAIGGCKKVAKNTIKTNVLSMW